MLQVTGLLGNPCYLVDRTTGSPTFPLKVTFMFEISGPKSLLQLLSSILRYGPKLSLWRFLCLCGVLSWSMFPLPLCWRIEVLTLTLPLACCVILGMMRWITLLWIFNWCSVQGSLVNTVLWPCKVCNNLGEVSEKKLWLLYVMVLFGARGRRQTRRGLMMFGLLPIIWWIMFLAWCSNELNIWVTLVFVNRRIGVVSPSTFCNLYLCFLFLFYLLLLGSGLNNISTGSKKKKDVIKRLPNAKRMIIFK